MPQNYTGVAGAFLDRDPPTISEPVGSDPPSAASVNTPFQQLADAIASLRAGAAALTPALNQVSGGVHYLGHSGFNPDEPQIQNGGAFESGGVWPHFWTDITGTVHLGGQVSTVATGVMFTLPAAYAPAGLIRFAASTGSGIGTITIDSSGNVSTDTIGAVDMSGISFYNATQPLPP